VGTIRVISKQEVPTLQQSDLVGFLIGRTIGVLTIIFMVLKYNIHKVFTLLTVASGLNWIVLGFNVKNLQLVIWMNLPIAGFCESSLYGLPIYLI
jgi:hypothetical protein